MNSHLRFVLYIIFAMVSCHKVETSPIILEVKHGAKNLRHAGQGVFMDVPKFYKKASSYDGFQAPNYLSSISIKVSGDSLETVLNSFNENKLNAQKIKLLELRPVNYRSKYSGYWITTKSKRDNKIKMILALKTDDKLYMVIGYYFEELEDEYEKIVRNALENIQIQEKFDRKEEFVLANWGSEDNNVILTLDAKYPTENENGWVIEEREIRGHHDDIAQSIVSQYDKNKTMKNTRNAKMRLENGDLWEYNFNNQEKMIVILIFPINNVGQRHVVIGYGKNNDKFIELHEYIQKKYLKVKFK